MNNSYPYLISDTFTIKTVTLLPLVCQRKFLERCIIKLMLYRYDVADKSFTLLYRSLR